MHHADDEAHDSEVAPIPVAVNGCAGRTEIFGNDGEAEYDERMGRCPVCGGDHPRRDCKSADEALPSGFRLDDKYVIIRHLSTGGMGAVYEVEHAPLGKRLAAKVLLPELAKRPRLLERFRREARAASATGHENIVEVTDLGQTPQRAPFLVMELLQGRTLGAELKQGPISPERAVHIARQILSALSAAHGHGIVHRDLKPENIFLIKRGSDNDFVKVLDFGIAKMLDEVDERELTQAGQVVGTPTYMAPEQARGDKTIDGRADLYAVGAILYRMVTGHRPFSGDSFNALLFAIAQGNPVRPRQHNASVSPLLESVILKSMAVDRTQRYQTAEEYDEALAEEARTEERSVGKPVGPPVDTAPGFSETMHGGPETGRVRRVISTMTIVLIAGGIGVSLSGGGYLLYRKLTRTRPVIEARIERPPPEPAMMPLVELKLDVLPASAKMTIDGVVVRPPATSLARDGARHVLHVEAAGFLTEDRPFFASSDQILEVRLKKRAPKHIAPKIDDDGEKLDPAQVKLLQGLVKQLGEAASQE
jgi:serine/threonine protein kinase